MTLIGSAGADDAVEDVRTPDKASSAGYTRVAIMLHWTIAVLILFNLPVGFIMEGLPPGARRIVISAHLSSGLTILALTVVRIVWRLTHRPPAFLPGLHGWERRLATLVHALFYAGMIVMPLSGWAIISANPPVGSAGALARQRQVAAEAEKGRPVGPVRVSGTSRFWWVIRLPPLAPLAAIGARPEGIERQHRLHELFAQAHSILAYLMIALLLLHVGGALRHQLIDGQPQLARMGLTPRRRTADTDGEITIG